MCLLPYFSASVNIWHGFSSKFHVISCHKSTAVWSTLTPNSMTIPCHLSRFVCFPYCQTWNGFYRFKSWNFHGMNGKMIHWISSDLVSFATKLPWKRHEKLRITFFTGMVWFIFTLSISSFEWNMIR